MMAVTSGVQHIGLAVSKLEESAAFLTVIREGPSMHMMCYDPSGIRIEFYYPGQG